MVPCRDLVAQGRTDTIVVETEGWVKNNYLDFGYCVDDEAKKITLGGEEIKDLYECFTVGLYPCTLTDGSCKHAENLGEFLFLISFPCPLTNYGDYKNPIRYVTDGNEFIGISNVMFSRTYHNLRMNDVIQERGFLSTPEVTHKFSSTEKESVTVTSRDPGQTTCPHFHIHTCIPYVIHYFLLTNSKHKITREYKGLVESISEIGGMIDIIFLLFTVIYSIYHARVVQATFVRELYGLEKPASTGCCLKKNKVEFKDPTKSPKTPTQKQSIG